MDVAWVAGGLLVVAIGLTDALWTTLWPDGRGGPIASNLGRVVWHLAEAVSRGSHRTLSLAGPAALFGTVVVWVATVAAGWTLVMTPEQALASTRAEPEDLAGRIWFVVYTMHTVGNGDYTPSTDWSELAASVTAFTGMALITLAVTYLLSVVRAVAERRSFATHVASLGDRPEEIVANAWDGSGFPGLDSLLDTISSDLSHVEHQRRAFPMVQYFHPSEARRSSEMMLGMLDDALTLWLEGVAEPARPAPGPLQSARTAVRDYLRLLRKGPISAADETPPPPDLARLRAVGIPTVSDGAFSAALAALDDRRRMLRAVVRSDGWEWDSMPG